jgi:hypothetical protein
VGRRGHLELHLQADARHEVGELAGDGVPAEQDQVLGARGAAEEPDPLGLEEAADVADLRHGVPPV